MAVGASVSPPACIDSPQRSAKTENGKTSIVRNFTAKTLGTPAVSKSWEGRKGLYGTKNPENLDNAPTKKRVRFAEEVQERAISEDSASDSSSANGSSPSSDPPQPIVLNVPIPERAHIPLLAKDEQPGVLSVRYNQIGPIKDSNIDTSPSHPNRFDRNSLRRSKACQSKCRKSIDRKKIRPAGLSAKSPPICLPFHTSSQVAYLELKSRSEPAEPIIIPWSGLLAQKRANDGNLVDSYAVRTRLSRKSKSSRGKAPLRESDCAKVARKNVRQADHTLANNEISKVILQYDPRTGASFRDV